ncbi:hypothetical protein ACFL35_21375, partial [Candidatus Riflebacteria bacterium]
MNGSYKKAVLLDCLKVFLFVIIIYISVIAVILALQHRRLDYTSPLNFKEIEEMQEMAKSERKNLELREKIRHLDLIARRTWFAGKEWLNTGTELLLYGVIALLLCLAAINSLKPQYVALPAEKISVERTPASEVSMLALIAGLSV